MTSRCVKVSICEWKICFGAEATQRLHCPPQPLPQAGSKLSCSNHQLREEVGWLGSQRFRWGQRVGVLLFWIPAKFSANEVFLALHICLIESLQEKGALSLPFVIRTIAAVLCVLSTEDGIFTFISLVLFQPYVLVPSFTAVIFQPGSPRGRRAGEGIILVRADLGPLATSTCPPHWLLSQKVPFILWVLELSLDWLGSCLCL